MKKLQIAPLILLVTITFIAHAQKLPNIQQTSLRAPDNIKIDGKATEWNNQFQAYNKATEVFYTLSNDDNNLYLTVQATNPDIINKIYSSGLTFTVNLSNKKNDKEGISITYPIFDKENRFHVNIKAKPVIIPNSQLSIIKADSFMNANNTLMTNKAKLIMVTGISGIDTLISVYNEKGIKAAALFDNGMTYTLELGMPLRHLRISVNDSMKFAYHVQLHPIRTGSDNVKRMQVIDRNGNMVNTVEPVSLADIQRAPLMISTTDFWGEYTLAKK